MYSRHYCSADEEYTRNQEVRGKSVEMQEEEQPKTRSTGIDAKGFACKYCLMEIKDFGEAIYLSPF